VAVKVLHIIKSLGRGGAEMLLPETLKFHEKEEFEFHYIYFLPWKNQMVEAITNAGGKVTCFPASNNLKILLQTAGIIRYIRQHKIELVHCHLPWAGFAGRMIHFKTKIPVLYTEHNKQERYHFATRLLNRFTFNMQSAAIAVSADVAASIAKNIQPHIPMYTILNGVDTTRFMQNKTAGQLLRKQYGINETDFLIGTIAVFRFQKRLDVWLEIIKKLKEKHPAVKAVIIGDGQLKAELFAKRKELELEEVVLMPGLQTNTVEWLSAMDLFMMSSVFEGLPVALLEAMSCEVPVICTNAGGVGEVVKNGSNGLLVEAGNPYQLIDKAEQMISDAALAKKLAMQARADMIASFGMKRMVDQLQHLYHQQIKK
jgi:L-malate glycosyltransferase